MQKFRNLCSSRFFASGWCCRKWSGNHTRCPSVIGDRNMMGGGFHLFIIGVEVTWAHNLAERSKIVVVLGLFLPWLAWLIPTLEINKILRLLRYDSIPDPHYNNNLIKIVMHACNIFSARFLHFLYLVQCNIKMALKNEGDADFVLLDAKKTGVIFTLYWWCPDMSKSRYWQPQNFFKTSFFTDCIHLHTTQ